MVNIGTCGNFELIACSQKAVAKVVVFESPSAKGLVERTAYLLKGSSSSGNAKSYKNLNAKIWISACSEISSEEI